MSSECSCGASHATDAPGSGYFVSVIDGPRQGLAAGPYDTHEEALADVEEVRRIGEDVDPRAVFYAWGTCRVDRDVDGLRVGSLNAELVLRRALGAPRPNRV